MCDLDHDREMPRPGECPVYKQAGVAKVVAGRNHWSKGVAGLVPILA